MINKPNIDKSLPPIEQYRIAIKWLNCLNETYADNPEHGEILSTLCVLDDIWAKMSDADCKIIEEEAKEEFKGNL